MSYDYIATHTTQCYLITIESGASSPERVHVVRSGNNEDEISGTLELGLTEEESESPSFPLLPSTSSTSRTDTTGEARQELVCPEMQIVHGDPLTDRKSTFQAHVAAVHSVHEVYTLTCSL